MIYISDYVDLFFLIFTHIFLFSVLGVVFYFALGDTSKGAFGEFAGFYRWGHINKRVGPLFFFATKRI